MLKRVTDYSLKGIFPASRLGVSIGAGLLVILALLTVADVVLRRFFNSPIPGTAELTELGLGIIVFLALALCALQDSHVVVDVVVSRFPKRAQASIGAVMDFCSAWLLGLMSWQLFLYAMRVRDMGQTSTILGIESYPFVLIAILGSALLTLLFFVQFLFALAEVRRR